MDLPITLLKRIKSYTALRVYICLVEGSKDSSTVMLSLNRISELSGVSRNSVKKAMEELQQEGLVKTMSTKKDQSQSIYYVSKTDIAESDIPKTDMAKTDEKWNKAFGSKGSSKTEQVNNIYKDNINNILNKDFNNINLMNNDINSISIVNEIIYMTDEQLGKLARRILVEWFIPLAEFKERKPKSFFPQQMKILKDLLVKWRLEQVLASIYYWTKVKPPNSGMHSLRYLLYENKGRSNVMVALDYFKAEHVKRHDQELKAYNIENAKRIAKEMVERKKKEREKVASQSDEEFASDLLAGFGSIKIE